MPNGNCFFLRTCFASLTALLALTLFAPTPTSGKVDDSSQADGSVVDSGFSSPHFSILVGATTETDEAPRVSAVLSETEDEESDQFDALDEPRVCFFSPATFREVRDRRLIAPSTILAHYPLRC